MSGNIVQLLWSLKRGALDEQARAGHQIYLLESMGGDAYKNDDAVVRVLVDQGAIPLAVELMESAPGPVQEAAALILRPICPNNRQKVLAAGVLPPLMKMLQQGPEKGPAHYAAGLIVNLGVAEEAAKKIRELGALPLLFQIIESPKTPTFGRYQAIDAIGSLAKFDEESARLTFAAPGILPLLVKNLLDPETAAVAASTMGDLGHQRKWALEKIRSAGAIPALIGAFNTTDLPQLDYAVHALLRLVNTDDLIFPDIIKSGGLAAILTVLEERDRPDSCVQPCAGCIIAVLWKKDYLRGPIRTALASFVRALGPRLASTNEAESVTALKGLLSLVDGTRFREPELAACLVQSGAIPQAATALADPRPPVKVLGIQILNGLATYQEQTAARDALLNLDFAATVVSLMKSGDPLQRAKVAEFLRSLVAYEHRNDAWWTDPPTLIRPPDLIAHRLVTAGIVPVCLHWIYDVTETEAVRQAGTDTLTSVCFFRTWGQMAIQQSSGIQVAIEVLVRPDTPAYVRNGCAHLLANAVAKHEHATWTFIQAGGLSAIFQALELAEEGDALQKTINHLMTTLRNAWEIVSLRAHTYPALQAFVAQVAKSAGGNWARRDRLLKALFTALDPEVLDTPVDATLQEAFSQAGVFNLLIPMLNDPNTAAQVRAADILRVMVFANQALKRTLNNLGGLTRLFEALNRGDPKVQEAVLKCLGEEFYQAGELSVLAIKKMEAVKVLTQCVVHGAPAVQRESMFVIGKMTYHQAVTARLMGAAKPRLVSILIEKAKDTAGQPDLQYAAVEALNRLSPTPKLENIKQARKAGMIPVFLDILRNGSAEDRTRILALRTLTDNSRAYDWFAGRCARYGIYPLLRTLKADPNASPAIREAAADAFKHLCTTSARNWLSLLGFMLKQVFKSET